MKSSSLVLYITLFISMSYLTVNVFSQQDSSSGELTALAEEFVGLMVKGDFVAAVQNFDSTMKSAMPAEKLEETWKSVLGQLGAFNKVAGTRTEKWQQYDLVFVTCEFEHLTIDAKVVFDSKKKIAGLWFVPSESQAEYQPPAYANMDLFSEKEVVVGSGEWELPGTLTVPSRGGPFAAVVLVHGSGPQDRDESTGINKPFCDIAWGLGSRGIAVLRYEKRTKAHTVKFAANKEFFTVNEETVEDALKAVSLLQEMEEINPGKVFVLGHSLGGMMTPRMGAADPSIAGFIVMAGPATPVEDAILAQTSYIYSLDGVISDHEKLLLDQLEKQVTRVKDPSLSERIPASDLPLGLPARYWLDLREYVPPERAADLAQPMLILQGERDYQVTMEDFQIWKAALAAREKVTFKSYPKLNHLFMEGEGRSTPTEYQRQGHVAAFVIEDIAEWVKKM